MQEATSPEASPAELASRELDDEAGASPPVAQASLSPGEVVYRQYAGEGDLTYVMGLIDNELSEPYSIFTYRYFLHTWPRLCFLAFYRGQCFGTVVCKVEPHGELMRGYVAMLVVDRAFRGLGVGTELVKRAIEAMALQEADEVTLEAEVTNTGALSLYTNLGFIRDKRLARYYMNGVDAFRLKLLLPPSAEKLDALAAATQLSNMAMQQGSDAQHLHPCGNGECSHDHHHHHRPHGHQHAATHFSLQQSHASAGLACGCGHAHGHHH